jgi:UDP-glucose 4-epimerase
VLGDLYGHLFGVDVVSLRITEVYGLGNPMPSILPEMLRAAIDSTAFTLEQGGDDRFQFVHVQDVARSASLAARATALTQPVYNIIWWPGGVGRPDRPVDRALPSRRGPD